VNFSRSSDRVKILFVECLAALPNLHTLEITSMFGRNVHALVTALENRKLRLRLQQIRTLILPAEVHRLLRYCPNVEDLTCCATMPDEAFVESLVVGGLDHITKLSVFPPGKRGTRSNGDVWSSRVHFVSFSLTARQTHTNSRRDGRGLSRRSRTICRACKPNLPPPFNR